MTLLQKPIVHQRVLENVPPASLAQYPQHVGFDLGTHESNEATSVSALAGNLILSPSAHNGPHLGADGYLTYPVDHDVPAKCRKAHKNALRACQVVLKYNDGTGGAELHCRECKTNVDKYDNFLAGPKGLRLHYLDSHEDVLKEALKEGDAYQFLFTTCVKRVYSEDEVDDIRLDESLVQKVGAYGRIIPQQDSSALWIEDEESTAAMTLHHFVPQPNIVRCGEAYMDLACHVSGCRAEKTDIFTSMQKYREHVKEAHAAKTSRSLAKLLTVCSQDKATLSLKQVQRMEAGYFRASAERAHLGITMTRHRMAKREASPLPTRVAQMAKKRQIELDNLLPPVVGAPDNETHEDCEFDQFHA